MYQVDQRFDLGDIAYFNGKEVRINAFRYEVRPMGIFKVYEISSMDFGNLDIASSDVVEHHLKSSLD